MQQKKYSRPVKSLKPSATRPGQIPEPFECRECGSLYCEPRDTCSQCEARAGARALGMLLLLGMIGALGFGLLIWLTIFFKALI